MAKWTHPTSEDAWEWFESHQQQNYIFVSQSHEIGENKLKINLFYFIQ